MRQNARVSFWRRLFHRHHTIAAEAEARGDLVAAAQAWEKAGDDAALARVKRALAADAALDEAVRLHRAAQALDPTPDGARGLAAALLALAERQAPDAASAGRLEAGAILEQHGDDTTAARAYEAAGAWQDAADSYAEIGDIEAVERVIASGSALEVAQLTTEGLKARILAVAAAGKADRALEVLTRARARMPDSVELGRVAAAFEARLPRSGCLALGDKLLYRGDELVIGRAGQVTAAVRGLADRHLVLRRDGEAVVADDGRRFDARTQVELCVGCTVLLRPVPHGWSAALTVRGLAGEPVWWVDRYRCADGTELVADGRWWRAGERILLKGDHVADTRIG